MISRSDVPSVRSMNNLRALNWPMIVALGALALIRPLVRIAEDQLGIENRPAIPVSLTIVIFVVWVLVVGLSSVPEPVLTLVFAGLVYAVLAIALSGVLSPILGGELRGPLANPIAIAPMLLFNALWGLLAGALALAVRTARGGR